VPAKSGTHKAYNTLSQLWRARPFKAAYSGTSRGSLPVAPFAFRAPHAVVGDGCLCLGRDTFFFFDELMGLLGRKVFRLKTGLDSFALKPFPPRF
jgi:hypothetical protein